MTPWIVVRNTPLEGPDLLAEVLDGEGIAYTVLDAFTPGSLPDRLAGAGGLVVLGGPMGVYDAGRHPQLDVERRLLRQAVESDRPVLGICLGAQLLASARGAAVRPGPLKEIGWQPLTLTPAGIADPVLAPLATAPPVFHLHGDTYELPDGAVHLARSAVYEQQAFRIGRRAYGLQFHLELGVQTVRAVVEDPGCRADLLAQGRSPEAIIAESPGRGRALEPLAREVFRRFVRLR
jgi:GMP synthase-like glutamine amidotransferase